MNDRTRSFFKNYAQPSNTAPKERENIVQKKKRALPPGDDTIPCSFRLRGEEITFLESLPGKSLTDKLRLLLTLGRAAGDAKPKEPAKYSVFGALQRKHGIDCPDTTDQASSVDVIYALVTRIEKLEAAQQRRC
jgi:hypothetical protein